TEYYNEGPGLPSERASGTVPEGVNGVCRRPTTMRPLIVEEKLWEHTRTCSPQTPARFIRLGYTPLQATNEPEAQKEQEKLLASLKDGKASNNQLVSLIR